MSSLNSTPSHFIRPEFFILRGFSGIPYANYYYIFLFVCYTSAVVGNLLIMTIIIVARSLHTPKYMVVFNLALADLCQSSALFPSLVETFIYTTPKITYEACLITVFSDFLSFFMQSVSLTVLAYDRFAAICFPLRYHSIVTNTSMGALVAALWLFNVTLVTVMVLLLTGLSFCRSIIIQTFYCAYGNICELSCNYNKVIDTFTIIVMVLFYYIPIIFIVLSYISILLALFKIASWEERFKALKTCFSHMILVCVYYVPIVTIDMTTFFIPTDSNLRIIGTSLSCYVPTVLNPIVYSLSTAEIREFIKKMVKRNRTKLITPAVSE